MLAADAAAAVGVQFTCMYIYAAKEIFSWPKSIKIKVFPPLIPHPTPKHTTGVRHTPTALQGAWDPTCALFVALTFCVVGGGWGGGLVRVLFVDGRSLTAHARRRSVRFCLSAWLPATTNLSPLWLLLLLILLLLLLLVFVLLYYTATVHITNQTQANPPLHPITPPPH